MKICIFNRVQKSDFLVMNPRSYFVNVKHDSM